MHTEILTHEIFTLIDKLYSYEMDEVVISPGSRSTPLAIACELHPRIKTYIHPDERSAAFFALGLSKASYKPVGMVCTSGTAAANYTPAIVEAHLTHVPLVVLTADRPDELQNIGAPQTINQQNMYHNYVMNYKHLSIPNSVEEAIQEVELAVDANNKYFKGTEKGPIHLNIPVREPLVPNFNRTDLFFRDQQTVTNVLNYVGRPPTLHEEGIVVIGYTEEDLSPVVNQLNEWNIPVIVDPRQMLKTKLNHAVTNHDLIFNTLSDYQFEQLRENIHYVIRIGDPVTSKATNIFLKSLSCPQYIYSEHELIKSFPIEPTESFVGDINDLIERTTINNNNTDLLHCMIGLDQLVTQTIQSNIHMYDDEGAIVYQMIQQIQSGVIFASSSMPIRDIERYGLNCRLPIISNRGANGIDGVTSTALGLATKEKVNLFIGDVAFYHDMNGLVIGKLENIDINIFVFNNNGGGIFSFLPQYQHKEHFERLFGTPLDLNFQHTANLYEYNYTLVERLEDITPELFNKDGRNIIEIKTDRLNNLNAHQSLKECVEKEIQQYEITL